MSILKRIRKGHMFSEPSATPVMKCPACGQTLLYGLKVCRYCDEPIDEEYARRSARYLTALTRVCALANTIRTMRPAIGLLVVLGLMIYLAGFGPGWAVYLMFSSVMYSCAVVRWRWKYGDLVVPDAEFTEAQRMMKRELHLWLGVIALQVIALVVGWRFLGRQ